NNRLTNISVKPAKPRPKGMKRPASCTQAKPCRKSVVRGPARMRKPRMRSSNLSRNDKALAYPVRVLPSFSTPPHFNKAQNRPTNTYPWRAERGPAEFHLGHLN